MTKTRKESVSPDIMALIKAASHRFRDALEWLGKEKQTPLEKPEPSDGTQAPRGRNER